MRQLTRRTLRCSDGSPHSGERLRSTYTDFFGSLMSLGSLWGEHPTKVQPLSDQATIRVKAAPPRRGPPVIPMDGRVWLLIHTPLEYDHSLKAAVEESKEHEPHCREPDGAVCRPKIMQRMFDPHPSTRNPTSGWTR